MNLKAISIRKSKDMCRSVDIWHSTPSDITDNSNRLNSMWYHTVYNCIGFGHNLNIRIVSSTRRSLKSNRENVEVRNSINRLFSNRPVLESYMKWVGVR